MTVVSQNRNTKITFTALDNSWTVNSDVSVFVQADVAAASAIAGSRFTNNGVVFAAVNFNNGNGAVTLAGNNARIDNNAGASITGFDGGITVNGNGAAINNHGAVTGAREFGVLFGSGSRNVVLDNSGNIYGAETGVWVLNSVDGGTIRNSGVIRSGDTGISLSLGAGVVTEITNGKDGVIRGNAKAIEVNFGAIDFENLGTVVGLTHCDFQSGNDRIENRGTMGEVRLGAGDDVFVFAGGKQGLVTGGPGVDQFIFETKLAPKKSPATIADFTPGEDVFVLSKALFKKIGKPGALKEKAFALGTKAGDKSDRVIYDDSTGQLRYDKDGKGGDQGQALRRRRRDPRYRRARFRGGGLAGSRLPPERLLDRDGELLERERLGQEVEVLAVGQVLLEGLLGIARDEDDLELRPGLAELAQERRPVELRHHHVGDDEVDLAACLPASPRAPRRRRRPRRPCSRARPAPAPRRRGPPPRPRRGGSWRCR